jgi:hypothetical protein
VEKKWKKDAFVLLLFYYCSGKLVHDRSGESNPSGSFEEIRRRRVNLVLEMAK